MEYKVIALSVGGLNNKIFKSGDIVNEKNFIPGRAEQLVAQGFLRAVSPSVEVKTTPQTDLFKGGKRGKK